MIRPVDQVSSQSVRDNNSAYAKIALGVREEQVRFANRKKKDETSRAEAPLFNEPQ